MRRVEHYSGDAEADVSARRGGAVLRELVAEGEGFEPPVPFQVQRFSRPPVSTTHTSLRVSAFNRLSAAGYGWHKVAAQCPNSAMVRRLLGQTRFFLLRPSPQYG